MIVADLPVTLVDAFQHALAVDRELEREPNVGIGGRPLVDHAREHRVRVRFAGHDGDVGRFLQQRHGFRVDDGHDVDLAGEQRVRARRSVGNREELHFVEVRQTALPVILVARKHAAHARLEFLELERAGADSLVQVRTLESVGHDHHVLQTQIQREIGVRRRERDTYRIGVLGPDLLHFLHVGLALRLALLARMPPQRVHDIRRGQGLAVVERDVLAHHEHPLRQVGRARPRCGELGHGLQIRRNAHERVVKDKLPHVPAARVRPHRIEEFVGSRRIHAKARAAPAFGRRGGRRCVRRCNADEAHSRGAERHGARLRDEVAPRDTPALIQYLSFVVFMRRSPNCSVQSCVWRREPPGTLQRGWSPLIVTRCMWRRCGAKPRCA